MKPVTTMLKQGKKQEIWNNYCGFQDLSIDEYMSIQYDLLEKQIKNLNTCELGRKILGKKPPKTVDEFRRNVPLTTYGDYSEYLIEKREDVLPEKPFMWVHTSGRGGESRYKWIPYTKKMYEMAGRGAFACFIYSSCKKKGDIALKPGDKFIYLLAPPPYMTGVFLQTFDDQFDFNIFPPIEKAIKMDFQERIQKGLHSALAEGLDFFYGVTSIMMRMSEQFSQSDKSLKDNPEMKKLLRNPKVIMRFLKGTIKAKLHGRNLLPKDIWKVKGVMCAGTDTSIYKEKVKQFWGKEPYEAYGSTELGGIAIQPFNCEGLVCLPENSFYEFITEEEYKKWKKNRSYIPHSLLMNELEQDKEYVLIGTNFHGGILTRYIQGDLVKVISLRNKTIGLDLPQIVFSSRIDGIIDIGGFTRLTEKIIWKAIENTHLEYVEWTIRKESENNKPILHLYIELKDQNQKESRVQEKIHNTLKEIHQPYTELESMASIKPLKATLLSKGSFQRYYEERQAAGADLAHLKPSHINPPDTIIEKLIQMSDWSI